MRHVPVLLPETISALQLKKGMNVIDCTLGDAGHADAILQAIGPKGKLLGIDTDPEAVLRAKQFLYPYGDQIIFVRENFIHLKKIVTEHNFRPVNAILMDLGWSTSQFFERGRGLSFQFDEPLDMRYSGILEPQKKTAARVLNESSEEDLARIFKIYGEENLNLEIARAIGTYKKHQPIETTKELADIILIVYRDKLGSTKEVPWVGGLHPATKVFQALRIAVNEELTVLEQTLPQAVEVLESGGRLAVITFHSLEDRLVKHWFKSQDQKTVEIITKKSMVCGPLEYESNPPSRSAKLRVVQKI